MGLNFNLVWARPVLNVALLGFRIPSMQIFASLSVFYENRALEAMMSSMLDGQPDILRRDVEFTLLQIATVYVDVCSFNVRTTAQMMALTAMPLFALMLRLISLGLG